MISDVTIEARKQCFYEAYNISKIEFGKLHDSSMIRINQFIYNNENLDYLLKNEKNYWSKEKNLRRNRDFFCVGMSTLNLMKIMITNIPLQFDYNALLEMHNDIFDGISIAGKLRNNKEGIHFMGIKFPYISLNSEKKMINNTMSQLTKLSKYASISQVIKEVSEDLKNSNDTVVTDNIQLLQDIWRNTGIESELRNISLELAEIVCSIFQAGIFVTGNLTIAFFIIFSFLNRYEIPIDKMALIENNMKQTVFLAIMEKNYDTLARMIYYAMDKGLRSIKKPDVREALIIKIEKARKEKINGINNYVEED